MPGKFYKWTVEIEIVDTLVADGFDLTDAKITDIMARANPYAFGHEFKARVIARPADAEVAEEQGFKSVSEYLERRGR